MRASFDIFGGCARAQIEVVCARAQIQVACARAQIQVVCARAQIEVIAAAVLPPRPASRCHTV